MRLWETRPTPRATRTSPLLLVFLFIPALDEKGWEGQSGGTWKVLKDSLCFVGIRDLLELMLSFIRTGLQVGFDEIRW